jgi:glycosyltransferase involved in cell wall biosynthesis
MAKGFIKAKVGAILVDYYNYMDPVRTSMSQKVYYKLLKNVDSFAFVTEHLQKLVNCDEKDYIIVEGLVSGVAKEQAPAAVENYCVYAGGLQKRYGVGNLVDAFHEMDLPYTLHLYGNGNMIDYIREVAAKDPRIEYKGIVSHDELLQIERGAKLLINPRPVYGELDTRFNFPSKLMEYMQSGRPVITTKLLGIPEEYEGKMFFFENDTTDALKEGIRKVLAMEEAELAAFGKAAKQHVDENKNNVAVGRRLFNLMNGEERNA